MVKVNNNKQIRLDNDLCGQIAELSNHGGLSESDIIRMALKAGLRIMKSGQYNPFNLEKLDNLEYQFSEDTDTKKLIGFYKIPFFGQISAGKGLSVDNKQRDILVPKKLLPSYNERYIALEVKGNSMVNAPLKDGSSGLFEHDIVILEQDRTPLNDDIVAALDVNRNIVIKRFVQSGRDFYIKSNCPGDNSIYKIKRSDVLAVFICKFNK